MNALLDSLVLTLTERCNFGCAHCYGDYGHEGPDMLLNHALNCIELASRHNAKAVFLTGGEPTLYPGLVSCIDKAVSLGMHTIVASNGGFKLDRLADMKHAGLQEVHISYDKYHASYITADRVKSVIDRAGSLGIRPVLILIEANSYAKYLPIFGDYYRFCIPGHTFKPIVYAGRAVHLPMSDFVSDTLLPVSKRHDFGIFVWPQGRVSFCPVNRSLPSTAVDLASNWLEGVMARFSQDTMVETLLKEGLPGLLRRNTGMALDDWSSYFYECNLCLQATKNGASGDPGGFLDKQSQLRVKCSEVKQEPFWHDMAFL